LKEKAALLPGGLFVLVVEEAMDLTIDLTIEEFQLH